MKDRDILNAMGGIDPELLAEAEAIPARRHIKGAFFKRALMAAACLCLLVALSVIIIMNTAQVPAPVLPPEDGVEGTDPTVGEGMKFNGKTQIVIGSKEELWKYQSPLVNRLILPGDGIYWGAIVEARVIEVLPDVYFVPGGERYRIARLQIIDQIVADGYPNELYMCYDAYYGADVFDGFDSFIIGLDLIAYEGTRMINIDRNRVESFPNIYGTAVDIGYGDVMAFTDGVYDLSFFDKVDYPGCIGSIADELLKDKRYPAKVGSTVDEAKENIRKIRSDAHIDVYRTAEEVFGNEVVFEAYKKLMNDSQSIFLGSYKLTDYRRSINGFLTEDIASINEETGEITYSEEYTSEDIAALPDLGAAMAELDIANMELPHLDLPSGSRLFYATANGFYRKNGDKLYGIIKICWYYKCEGMPEDTSAIRYFAYDYCYYLYETDGSSRMIEVDELVDLIGKDPYVARESYGYITSMT